LDQRDRAAVGLLGLLGLQPGPIDQGTRDGAVYDLQHRRHQLGLRRQQQAQRNRQRQNPVAHRDTRDDMVDQVGRRLGHAPGSARRTKPPALAAEGDQLVVAAVAAAQPQEAMRQDAVFEKGVELARDEFRQVGDGRGLSLLEEGGGVLLHQAVQRGLLRAVAFVVDWGLPVDGLHARLPRL